MVNLAAPLSEQPSRAPPHTAKTVIEWGALGPPTGRLLLSQDVEGVDPLSAPQVPKQKNESAHHRRA